MNTAPHKPDQRPRPDVLIVDDHADTSVLLQHLLRIDGYSSIAVASAGEALAFLAVQSPRLVITDYNMPEMDGLQLLNLLRADHRYSRLPVIVFSAMIGGIREQSLSMGADAFIPKSTLDWAVLRAELARLIGTGSLPEVSPAPAPRKDLRAG